MTAPLVVPASVPASYRQDFTVAVNRAASEYGVPADPLGVVLAAVIGHESSWQVAARHVNTNGSVDRGLAQINNEAHPQVTNALAYSPQYALDWSAGYIAKAFARSGSWSSAVQSYNPGAPGYAQTVLKGVQLPSSGAAVSKLAARSPTLKASSQTAPASGGATTTTGSTAPGATLPGGSGFTVGGFGGGGVPWWVQLLLVVGGAGLIWLALKRIF